MVPTLVALLLASVLFVPISRRLGLGSVLGYLVAGSIIGPLGLRLITDVGQIADISALGVVMLLFLIGLELRPERLWVMRKTVFGLGAAQVFVSAVVIAGLAYLAGINWQAAIVLGVGLALSSTAIVLPMLAERNLLGSGAGRDIFAVLLFPGSGVHPARCARAAPGTRRECSRRIAGGDAASALAFGSTGGRRDHGHPGGRTLLGAAGLPRDRRRPDARGVHRTPPF